MRLFIFSDLHGNKTLFNKMKEYMDNCGDEYFCYCLGDVCDRGPDGYWKEYKVDSLLSLVL